MWKNIKKNISNVFVEVVRKCFFPSWMFKDKLSEI